MSFGLTFDKLIIIAVIAVFLIGPDRLPGYAAQLARLVKTLRGFADGARDRVREEMGDDFSDVDWKKLDPRQYDPRRIIREALLEDGPLDLGLTTSSAATATAGASGSTMRAADPEPDKPRYVESAYEKRRRAKGDPVAAPYDGEAT